MRHTNHDEGDQPMVVGTFFPVPASRLAHPGSAFPVETCPAVLCGSSALRVPRSAFKG
jgi:hypothetical protein